MLNMDRRSFLAILTALPMLRLPAFLRKDCAHEMVDFRRTALIPGGSQLVFGSQCKSCGQIKMKKQGRVRWGGFAESPDSYSWEEDVELQ